MLHTGPDALFDDIAFEVSVRELIDEDLAPISKQTSTQLDVSGVGTRGGEFIAGQLEAAIDQDPITQAAIDEVVAYGRDRRSWLLFCAGVDHAGTSAMRSGPRLPAPPSSGTRPRPSAIGSSPPSSAARSGRSPRWAC